MEVEVMVGAEKAVVEMVEVEMAVVTEIRTRDYFWFERGPYHSDQK